MAKKAIYKVFNGNSFEDIYFKTSIEQVEGLQDDLTTLVEDITDLNNHTEDKDNPHEVTAEQVDTYTKAEIDNKDTAIMDKVNNLEGNLNDVEDDPTLDNHIDDKNNPHEVTAEQVGTYSKVEIDDKDTVIMDKVNILEDTTVKLTGTQTIKGDTTFEGNTVITGDLTVSGDNFIAETTTVRTDDDLIELRSKGETPITTPAGIAVKKYDGTNDGGIVIKNDGEVRVGKITLDTTGKVSDSSKAQPVLTRAEKTALNNNDILVWDEDNNRAITKNLETIGIADTTALNEHIEDKDNPHEVTAEQIGTYDKEEIDDKDTVIINKVNNIEINLNDLLDDMTLDNHIADKDNPHEVTAEQVDTYTKSVIDYKDTAVMNVVNNLKDANMFKDVEYNNENSVLTFTKYYGDTKEIELPFDKSELLGVKNLGSPDLEGKEYLGNGDYILGLVPNGITVKYNVYSGIYTLDGLADGGSNFRLFTMENTINLSTLSVTYVGGNYNGIDVPYGFLESGGTGTSWVGNESNAVYKYNSYFNNIGLILFPNNSNGFTYNNYQFKIQLEKGDTATAYQIPIQPIIHHETKHLEDNSFSKNYNDLINKPELIGVKNLGSPDLEGKEYLGDGVYQLHQQNDGYLTYNVYNGEYRIFGDLFGDLIYQFGYSRPTADNAYIQVWKTKQVIWEDDGLINVFGGANADIYLNKNIDYQGRIPASSSSMIIYIYGVRGQIDVSFKMQLEKGDTATAYQVPIQPIIYHETKYLEGETDLGITKTGTTNTITSNMGTSAVITGATADEAGLVTTGTQTWSGYKTFELAPLVPLPEYDNQVASKVYVDDKFSSEISGTNLNNIRSGTTNTITSNTGNDATIYGATDEIAGLVTTGDQTWGGIKRFNSSPTVPDPANNNHAANKGYVDGKLNNKVDKTVNLTSQEDLNTILTSGFYRLQSGHNNGPSGANYNYAQMIVSSGGDTAYQMVLPYESNSIYIRNGAINGSNMDIRTRGWTKIASEDWVTDIIENDIWPSLDDVENNMYDMMLQKQDKLTAGDNITIDANNRISASSGDVSITKPEIDNALKGTNTNSLQLGINTTATATASTAVGYLAKAEGISSTALGRSASASEYYATALGMAASASGNSSTALGRNAKAEGGSTTAVGYNAQTGISANVMQLGSATELSVLRSRVTLTVTSDIRDKADIEEVPKALDFIKDLNPITYVGNDRDNYISEEQKETETYKDYLMVEDYDRKSHSKGTKKGKRRRVGLSAQEVREKLIEHYGSDNYANVVNDNFVEFKDRNLDIPKGLENKLTMSYETMVPFLIKAIQEQQEQIEELKKQINKE